MWIVLRLFIVCIVLFLIKKSNLSFYQKYQGAFDSQPGDFTMVKMAFETVDNVWYSINKKILNQSLTRVFLPKYPKQGIWLNSLEIYTSCQKVHIFESQPYKFAIIILEVLYIKMKGGN